MHGVAQIGIDEYQGPEDLGPVGPALACMNICTAHSRLEVRFCNLCLPKLLLTTLGCIMIIQKMELWCRQNSGDAGHAPAKHTIKTP